MNLGRACLSGIVAAALGCAGESGSVSIDEALAEDHPTSSVGPATSAPGTPEASGVRYGANVGRHGGVRFRVWAPHATAAWVTGNFSATKVAMTRQPGGNYSVHVPAAHAGSTYAYVFQSPSGNITRIDPYCRELTTARDRC